MPNTGTIWGLPNFAGELFTSDTTNTPLLTMSGGLTGGKVVDNYAFPTSSEYDLPGAAQPNITEDASIAGVNPTNVARTQVVNVCQIHQEAVITSYVKEANKGRLSGVNTAGQQNSVMGTEKDWQIARKLEKIARDVEFSMVQGTYVAPTNAATATRTRGMVEACQLGGGTNVDQGGAALDLDAMQSLFLAMYNNGAPFSNLVLYLNGTYKQQVSAIYGYAPESRNVGGLNIQQVETDFGPVGVVTSRFAPANTILAIEMSVVGGPVFCETPGKGILFYEHLAKTGASERGQLFGLIGFDHGPAYAHGRLHTIL